MDKGALAVILLLCGLPFMSQSTIKMDKGALTLSAYQPITLTVAIHNKNGQGLLQKSFPLTEITAYSLSQSTIKMDKGYYKKTQKK